MKITPIQTGQVQIKAHHLEPRFQARPTSPRTLSFDGEPWEGFEASHPLTTDETVRPLPTAGHMSVVIEEHDHPVLLTGDATYSEAAMPAGTIDGVAHDAKAHRHSTALLRDLCLGMTWWSCRPTIRTDRAASRQRGSPRSAIRFRPRQWELRHDRRPGRP